MSPSHSSIISGNNNLVTGGSFMIQIGSPDTGIQYLSQAASKEATHDSAARYPPPRCHCGTRIGILDVLLEWIKNPNTIISIYWLHAPLGHGKSAIIQTVIERLIAEGRMELLAGGFFFGRDKPGRGKSTHLLPSIALQIAINIPGMREHINNAMTTDPNLPYKSIETQMRSLIIEPLSQAPPFHCTPTVLIDGLDECDDIPEQLAILGLISRALVESHVPLRFLISSRFEFHIQKVLEQPPLRGMTQITELNNSQSEMRKYLESEFIQIYDRQAHIMELSGIHKPWPLPETIWELTDRACGQYIYADTVVRFVGAHRFNPESQLEAVLQRHSPSNLFSSINFLYRLILEECPSAHRAILSAIITTLFVEDYIHTTSSSYPTVALIADIFQLPAGDIQLVIQSLSAVIENTGSSGFWVRHLSFMDFLKDEEQSGEFYCNELRVLETWQEHIQITFKKALNARGTGFQNPSTYRLLQQTFEASELDKEPTLPAMTSSDLEAALVAGRQRVTPGTPAWTAWYNTVLVLTEVITDQVYRQDPGDFTPWVSGEVGRMSYSSALYRECLNIWMSAADRTLSTMDIRLATLLIEMPPYGVDPIELVRETGADDEAVVQQHSHVFEADSSDRIVFRGDSFISLDHPFPTFLRHIRREFYSMSM